MKRILFLVILAASNLIYTTSTSDIWSVLIQVTNTAAQLNVQVNELNAQVSSLNSQVSSLQDTLLIHRIKLMLQWRLLKSYRMLKLF